MPITLKTLTAIQAAGTAVFKANAQLKTAAQSYGDQVSTALVQRPYDLGNDSLFEEWKSVSRLAQAMAQIEAELQKIHASASRLQDEVQPSSKARTLAAPGAAGASVAPVEVLTAVDATDVSVKKPSKGKAKSKAKTTGKAKAKAKAKTKATGTLPANAASLLAHLSKVLNPETFEKINQTAVGVAINMPKGSVGASVTRLLKEGFLIQDAALGFKLSTPAA